MPGQTSTKCTHRIISRILNALYFSRLLVFSHKKFGLRRKPLMLFIITKKLELLCISKLLSEIKLAGTSWLTQPLNGSVGPTSHGKYRTLLDSRPFGDLHGRCHGYVQIMHVDTS